MKKLYPLLAASAFLGSTLSANLLVSESFDNYVNDQTVVGQGPSTTGFTGNWSNTGGGLASSVDYYPRSGGLSYVNYAPSSTSGSLEAFRSSGSHSGGAKRISRSFDYSSPGTGDFFISFLFANNSTSAEGDTEFRFQAEGSENNDRDTRLSIDHSNNDITIGTGGQAGAETTQSGIAGTNLLIIRAIYDSDTNTSGNPNAGFYDRVEIWLNPEITASANPTLDDLGTPDVTGFGIMRNFDGGGNPMAFEQFNFKHSLKSGDVVLDGLTITNDLGDLIAIPEPGTYGLIFAGFATGLVFLRRLRKAK
ncbi:MAG: PEP-CTERM sorting domain-containing protein [Opitutales bacterium]|nr:PEP-CTERM sorting domain-containing protein [Opitutales bacterium]